MEVADAHNFSNTSEDDEGEHVNIEFDDQDDKDHNDLGKFFIVLILSL